jgi:hypothetical protein
VVVDGAGDEAWATAAVAAAVAAAIAATLYGRSPAGVYPGVYTGAVCCRCSGRGVGGAAPPGVVAASYGKLFWCCSE